VATPSPSEAYSSLAFALAFSNFGRKMASGSAQNVAAISFFSPSSRLSFTVSRQQIGVAPAPGRCLDYGIDVFSLSPTAGPVQVGKSIQSKPVASNPSRMVMRLASGESSGFNSLPLP
jgi:hypothetical protein